MTPPRPTSGALPAQAPSVPSEAERAAAESHALEAARLETLGRLAQRVAHDCNNLLMVVLGHADLVLATAEEANPSGWPSVQEDAAQVCQATRQAGELMRQLLDFARAAGDLDGRFRADRLLKEMGSLLRIAVPKSATLRIDGPIPPVTLTGSAGEIRQLITQLVLNAADGLPPEGGRVVVRLEEDRLSEESAAGFGLDGGVAPGPVAILEVQHNGRPGDRAAGTGGDPARPPGNGFATVLRIARRHRAAVRVESESGVGTRYRVAFPLER